MIRPPRVIARLSAVAAALVAVCAGGILAWRTAFSVTEIAPSRHARYDAAPKPAPPEDWPNWRGPRADGFSESTAPPLDWSDGRSQRWKVAVPGRGHASPVVCGDRVFLATADEEKRVQSVLCFDRGSGTRLWETPVHRGRFGEKHEKNTHASATPACDGTRLYAAFAVDGAVWLSGLDLGGRLVWQRKIAPFVSAFGFGSSPAIFGRLVIVAAESAILGPMRRLQTTSCLAAVDGETGDIVWRIHRPNATSCGTPIVGHVAGRWQLLLSGPTAVVSYDPSTGVELWRFRWNAMRTANTVAFDDAHVFASTALPDKELLCIRADGSGDVTESHLVWTSKRGAPDVPSLLHRDGTLFALDDGGVLHLFEATSGRLLHKKRLPGTFSSSPLACAGHVFASSEGGTTYVVTMEAPWRVVAENAGDEAIFATPAISRDEIFVRTDASLVCIGTPESAAASSEPKTAAEIP